MPHVEESLLKWMLEGNENLDSLNWEEGRGVETA